jgi:hypothetical protein
MTAIELCLLVTVRMMKRAKKKVQYGCVEKILSLLAIFVNTKVYLIFFIGQILYFPFFWYAKPMTYFILHFNILIQLLFFVLSLLFPLLLALQVQKLSFIDISLSLFVLLTDNLYQG